jgi:hypothetical protein
MIYRPIIEVIVESGRRDFQSKFISFFNRGTTLVWISGFPLLPGKERVMDIQGENACIEVVAEIKFAQRVEEPSIILMEGNALRLEYLECF